MSAVMTIACPKPSRFIPLDTSHLHQSPKAARSRPVPLPMLSPRSTSFAPYPSPTTKNFTPKRAAHTLHRRDQSTTIDVSKWSDYQPKAVENVGPVSHSVKSRTIKHISTSPYPSRPKVEVDFKAYREVQPISPLSPVSTNSWRVSSPASPASTTIDLYDLEPPRLKRVNTVELPALTPPAHKTAFAPETHSFAADTALLHRVAMCCEILQVAHNELSSFASPALSKHTASLMQSFNHLRTALSSPSWTSVTLGLDVGEADRIIVHVSQMYEAVCGRVTQGCIVPREWENVFGEAATRMKRLTHMSQ